MKVSFEIGGAILNDCELEVEATCGRSFEME